jgi:atypical dual specificity phosphatase
MLPDFRPDPIVDGVWVGREPRSPEEFALLRALGVTDVLTLIPEEEALDGGIHPQVAFRAAMANGMALHRVGIRDFDHRSMVAGLPRAIATLADLAGRGRRVYVHCAAGMNRSPTVVAAWLARRDGLTAMEAAARVRSLHPCVPDDEALRKVIGSA